MVTQPHAQQATAALALPILTPWSMPVDAEPAEARAQAVQRDLLFRLLTADVLDRAAPWLLPILLAARAKVIAAPGRFIVTFPETAADAVEIPALGVRLLLLPWVEPEERAN